VLGTPHDPLRGDLLLAALGVATGVATFLGGSLALRFKDKIHLILGFSAGAVIGVALLDLLPEAMQLGGQAHPPTDIALLIAAGFIVYFIVDRGFLIATGDHPGHRGHLGAASLTMHSFLDGLGIGLGFQVSAAVGAVLAIAVLAHDFSDGMNTINLSLSGSGDPRTARRWLIADAAAPIAGIGASRLIAVPQSQLAVVIAVFTGFFLYIGASELLPDSHQRYPRTWTTVATVLGIALIFCAVRLAGG
jgi:ZIP family zinc transporter